MGWDYHGLLQEECCYRATRAIRATRVITSAAPSSDQRFQSIMFAC